MKIQPSKDIILITLLLCIISIGSGVLFYLKFKSYLLVGIITIICMFITLRFFVAFGRTFIFDATGITVSILGISRMIRWNQFAKIAIYDSKNSIGYKDVACAGIEFSVWATPRRMCCSPASYCFLFHPYSYVFCTYANRIVQPNGIKYPVIYAVDEKEICTKLTSYRCNFC